MRQRLLAVDCHVNSWPMALVILWLALGQWQNSSYLKDIKVVEIIFDKVAEIIFDKVAVSMFVCQFDLTPISDVMTKMVMTDFSQISGIIGHFKLQSSDNDGQWSIGQLVVSC